MTAPILRPVSPFAVATLAPVPLLALGGLFGGWAILAAVIYMTLLRMGLDALIATAGRDAGPGVEFPAAARLSRVLGWAHFPLLLIGVAGLSGATGLGLWEGLGVLVAFGMYFGQVSNSNAHELIHRSDRGLFRLGKWGLISLLYGHHVSAHLKVHHRFVGTPDDPSTARLGEGFWAFARRAWTGAFVAGWEIERSIAKVKERTLPFWRHPYAEYLGGAAGVLLVSTLLFGASGLVAHLMLALYAQLHLLLSDYVQHYGLRRRRIDAERYEQVAPWHSWNAPHWFSGGLMLNAPRHSEHHTNPARPYPELSLPAADEGPRLPHSLPTMAAIALVPPLWRRVMDRRAERWQARIDGAQVTRHPPPPLLGATGDAAAPLPAPAEPMVEVPPSVAPEQVVTVPQSPAPAEPPVIAPPIPDAQDLLRRIEAAEASLAADEAAGPPPAMRRPASQRSDGRARTRDLWAEAVPPGSAAQDDPPATAPDADPPDPPTAPTAPETPAADTEGPEERRTMPRDARPPGGDDTAAPPPDGVTAAVARLFANQPKPPPRASMLPSIEDHPDTASALRRSPVRDGLRAAGLAARALAAILRGPPAPRPAAPDDEDAL